MPESWRTRDWSEVRLTIFRKPGRGRLYATCEVPAEVVREIQEELTRVSELPTP